MARSRILFGFLAILDLLQMPAARCVSAAELAPEEWTLSRCLEQASHTSPELKAAAVDVEMASTEARERRAALYAAPELQASAILLPEDKAIKTPFFEMTLMERDFYDLTLSVTQPIYAGGGLRGAGRAAAHQAEAAQWMARARSREVARDVTAAYYTMQRARALGEVARLSREQVAAHLRDLENLLAQGMLLRNDLLKVRVRLSQADLLVQNAATAMDQARLLLTFTMGIPPDTVIAVAPVEPLNPGVWDEDLLLERAYRTRPELTALDRALAAAHAAARAVGAARLPRLAAFGTYGYGKPGDELGANEWNDHWTVGLSSTYTIHDWGARASQTDRASLNIERLEIDLTRLKLAIATELRKAYLDVRDATRRVELARIETAQAEENFSFTRNLRSQGMAISTDFLDAETDLTKARTAVVQAEIDYHMAVNQLEFVVGEPLTAADTGGGER
ncbi:TolC family protein [bacterium]|nr:TolC family protein [candidate division CSSED10-310 bacterium]